MTEHVMVVMKRTHADHDETGRWPAEVRCADVSRSVQTDNGYRRVSVVELAD